MSEEAKNVKRINIECPSDLKKRLDLFCVNEDVFQKEVVIMAIELYLESMENKDAV